MSNEIKEIALNFGDDSGPTTVLQVETDSFTTGEVDQLVLRDGQMIAMLGRESGRWQLTIWPNENKRTMYTLFLDDPSSVEKEYDNKDS